MRIILITTCIIFAQCIYGHPKIKRDLNEFDLSKINLAGLSSQIIATNILKDRIDLNDNQVFSPLGISSLLAILAEGARDDVYKEFIISLGYPDNKLLLRESFRDILKNFRQDLNQLQNPSFKTWFYIYRNNTVNDEYKKILRDYYFVEVKDIDRYLYNWEKPTEDLKNENDNKEIEQEKSLLSESESSSISSSSSSTIQPSVVSTNSKDVLGFEELKKSKPLNKDEILKDEIVEQKDASKFDKVVEDKQYVEVPVIKDEISTKDIRLNVQKEKVDVIKDEVKREKEGEKQQESDINVINQNVSFNNNEKKDNKIPPLIRDENINKRKNDDIDDKQAEIKDIQKPVEVASVTKVEPVSSGIIKENEKNIQDNEAIKDDEKLEIYKKDTEIRKSVSNTKSSPSNEPEKISIPLKKLEEAEILQALENHFLRKRFSGGRALFQKDDVASALSANSLVGRESPNQTKMLLFNGLYYRGNWAYPFQELRSGDDDDLFYVSEDKKIPVIMMRTKGKYRFGNLDKLNAQAIELPYENKRYSLLILLPNEKLGLRSLIEKFESRDILYVKSKLNDEKIELYLPKFCTEQTSRSEETLKRLGLKKLFSFNDGGLENISEGFKLNVDEIVQHVNLRVDEGSGSQNILTATALEQRSSVTDTDAITEKDNLEEKPFKEIIKVDRPFLYFILDNENDFVMIAGKILEPKLPLDDLV